eukprot:1161221-Pelagomonas_calceolata.AAC.10
MSQPGHPMFHMTWFDLQNRLVHQSFGAEYFDGQIIYRASETATHFFIIVTGHVVLTDVKENKNDEGVGDKGLRHVNVTSHVVLTGLSIRA